MGEKENTVKQLSLILTSSIVGALTSLYVTQQFGTLSGALFKVTYYGNVGVTDPNYIGLVQIVIVTGFLSLLFYILINMVFGLTGILGNIFRTLLNYQRLSGSAYINYNLILLAVMILYAKYLLKIFPNVLNIALFLRILAVQVRHLKGLLKVD